MPCWAVLFSGCRKSWWSATTVGLEHTHDEIVPPGPVDECRLAFSAFVDEAAAAVAADGRAIEVEHPQFDPVEAGPLGWDGEGEVENEAGHLGAEAPAAQLRAVERHRVAGLAV